MRKRTMLAALLVLAAVILLCVGYSMPSEVEQEVAAELYVDGEAAAQTKIRIRGEKSRSLFGEPKMTYIGEFRIESHEPSCRDGVQACVTWSRENPYQGISYYYAGDFVTLGVERIIIDEDMKNIAVRFEDGTIASTSDELYLELKGK